MIKNQLYTISEVSTKFKVHIDTLRNWERRGIITPRRVGVRGDRRYSNEDVSLIETLLIPQAKPKVRKAKNKVGAIKKLRTLSENLKPLGLSIRDIKTNTLISMTGLKRDAIFRIINKLHK
jgi:hypothetical protein